jgi:putative salt-induced outer membrane protein YdiY
VVEVAAIRRDQGRLRLQPPDADPPIAVAPERVEVVNPEPWELGRGHRLSGAVNVGLQDSQGNSTSTELDLDFNLSYRRRWDEFESFGQVDYDTTRETKTTEQWSLRNKYIRRFPHTPWYGAVWLRFRHDLFADLRLRTIIGPGLGYQLQESEDTRLSVEFGPVHIREDYYDQNDLDHWGPGLFMDYEQDLLGDRVQLYLNGMGFTTVSGDSLDIWNSWAGLRIPLVGGFVSSIEYEVDYNSSPAEGAKTTDETLRLKMGYQW